MEERKILELVSLESVRKVAAVDSRMVSTSPEKYVENNVLAYYLVTNTWLMIIREYAEYAWATVAGMIRQNGLLPTIGWAQAEAEHIVHGRSDLLSDLTRSLLTEIRVTGAPKSVVLYDDKNIGRSPMATLLFLLRYPKRFSPNDADIIREDTIKDFIATERRTKSLQRAYRTRYTWDHGLSVSRYVVTWAASCISKMYDWDRLCDEIEMIDITDIEFSSGAGFDSRASLGSKLLAIQKHHPEYFIQPFGVRMVPLPVAEEAESRVARVTAVPKSYKAARIVAMEDTYRLAYAKRVESIFRAQDRETGSLCLTDQTINQQYAMLGSEDGRYATLDASHASDYISMSLFTELFPARFVRLIRPLMAEYVDIGGKRYVKQMFSTAGHTLTFRIESIVYKALAQAGSEFARLFRGEDPSTAFGWAYGDDTICYSNDVEEVIQFFQGAGLVINKEKSFWETGSFQYRESCGEEYINGINMSSVYFPRFPILGNWEKGHLILSRSLYNDEYRGKIDDATTMLIDLQHKLFGASYRASRLVWLIIKEALPFMTSTGHGQISPDLWAYDDQGRPAREPRRFGIGHVHPTLKVGDTVITLPEVVRKLEPLDGEVPERVRQASAAETLHYASYIAYDGREYTPLEKAVYDVYRYQCFLKRGPRYASDLDRLLGISMPEPPISQYFGKRRMAWRLQAL